MCKFTVDAVGSLLQGRLLTFIVLSFALFHFFVQTGNQHIYQPVGKQGNITLQVPELTTTDTHKYSYSNWFNCIWIFVNKQITQYSITSIVLNPLSDSCLQNTVYSCDNNQLKHFLTLKDGIVSSWTRRKRSGPQRNINICVCS